MTTITRPTHSDLTDTPVNQQTHQPEDDTMSNASLTRLAAPATIRPADIDRSSAVEHREPDSTQPPGERRRRAPVARCADGNGTMTGLFFSDNVVDIARAKAMCGLCPLQADCLQSALDREEPWGVWGGELLSGGRIVANKRPCGRPPKHPRPDVVYDEMGPVGVVA